MALEADIGAERPDPAGAEGARQRLAGRRRSRRCSMAARDWPSCEGLPAAWLAANARQALEFVATKPKGRHKLRVRSAAVDGNGAMPDGAMIEILNDDMPFLVDSVAGRAAGIGGSPCACCCTRFSRPGATRPAACRRSPAPVTRAGATGTRRATSPSIPRRCRTARRAISSTRCRRSSAEVRIVVADWRAMLERLTAAGRQLEMAPGSVPRDLLSESTAFVRWLAQDNFTLLGSREFELAGDASLGNLAPVEGSGLGVLRDPHIAGAPPRHRAGCHDAGGAALLLRAGAAHHHQGQRDGPRAPARVTWTTSASRPIAPTAASKARFASSASSRPRPTCARRRRSRSCATRSTA